MTTRYFLFLLLTAIVFSAVVPLQPLAAQQGNTFKSACWNHNLDATELLDCSACEKQYASFLPKLNELAAAKKQAQLAAFLGDCPRIGNASTVVGQVPSAQQPIQPSLQPSRKPDQVPVNVPINVPASAQVNAMRNPCADVANIGRSRAPGVVYGMLFNGTDNIRVAPKSPFPFPQELATRPPVCVKLGFAVTGVGAQRVISQTTLLALTRATRDEAAYVAVAEKIIAAAVRDDLFLLTGKDGWDYEASIPVWRDHSLFTGTQSQVAGTDLAHMGYSDAKKVGDLDGVEVYRVATLVGSAEIFVVVRPFKPNELIVPTADEMLPWFRRHIAPHVAGVSGTTSERVQLRLYAKGVTFAAREHSPTGDYFIYPPLLDDPTTFKPVERALKVVSFGGRRGTRATPLEWNLPPHNESADDRNTVAQIQAQAQLLADQERQRAVGAKERAERAGQQMQKAKAEGQRAYAESIRVASTAAAQKGLVYRRPGYWVEFNTYPQFGQILDGTIGDEFKVDINMVFMSVYMHYQSWFSAMCPSLIPAGSPSFHFETTYKDGPLDPGITTHSPTVIVRQEYWKKNEEFRQRLGVGYQNMMFNSKSDLALMTDSARTILNRTVGIRKDLERLFSENECGSGLQQQFSENLRRLAYGEPPLQRDAQQRFTFAARDTSKEKAKPSLTSACFDSRDGAVAARDPRWCHCLGEQFTGMLGEKERADAIADFLAFETKVTTVPATPKDPMWRYYSATSKCRN